MVPLATGFRIALIGLIATPLALPIPLPSAAGSGGRREVAPAVRIHRDGRTTGPLPTGMVLVPDGSFRMGTTLRCVADLAKAAPEVAIDRLLAMTPEHEAAVSSLLLDADEASNELFRRYLNDRQLAPPRELLDLTWNHRERGKRVDGLLPAAERLPATGISGDEAAACARWFGKRLPTEIEWEYAARRGRPAEGFYPWGVGWSAWSADRCACAQSSMKGRSAPAPLLARTFPADCAFDGIYDLSGNVAEWTSSAFSSFPGFDRSAAAEALGEKRPLDLNFDSQAATIRGGSFWGNQATNSLVFRFGAPREARFEAVGFRCALSAVAGLDVLRAAVQTLTPSLGRQTSEFDLSDRAIAAETIHPVDSQRRPLRARHIAFARVRNCGTIGSAKLRRDSVDSPRLIGLVSLSEPAIAPALAAGDYAVRFKARGEPKQPRLMARDRVDRQGRVATETTDPSVVPPTDRDVLLFIDARGIAVGCTAVAAADEPAIASLIEVAACDRGQTARFATSLATGSSMRELRLEFDLRFRDGAFAVTE
ncbi:MAG: hypothetical protein EXS13_07250 [Planctomycetes bacterium]|nr:hypothetical protein [Planctomycetota bacterium]